MAAFERKYVMKKYIDQLLPDEKVQEEKSVLKLKLMAMQENDYVFDCPEGDANENVTTKSESFNADQELRMSKNQFCS